MKIFAQDQERLDKFLAEKFPDFSREKIKNCIKNGEITVNSSQVKPSFKLSFGEEIEIYDSFFEKPQVLPEDLNLKVIYENDDFAIIDKDEGVMVHPAGSIYSGTLENGLLYRFSQLSDGEGAFRKGIVHRLDKDTTGLMVIVKNNDYHAYMKKLFMERKVEKIYYAIVHGNFDKPTGEIKTLFGRDENDRRKMAVKKEGRRAETSYRVLKQVPGFSLLKVRIKTGRTHQIRVHLTYINHPLLGDPLYGNVKTGFNLDHQLLHCGKLAFKDRDGSLREFSALPHQSFLKYQKILKLGDENVFEN